ncbi:MAG TPA: hypothetical protein VK669_05040 [Candidatus Limnocylindrales bacterium]|nr:hypothetical protein [Candidatus Limnocylindrales bacterium]
MKGGQNGPRTGIFGKSLDAWSIAVAAAGLVGAELAAFLLPPPFDLGPNDMLPKFGKFFVAVVIAVILAPFLRYSSRRHTARWAVLSVATLVASAVVFYWYLSLGAHFVREHKRADGSVMRYVIGASYSATGALIYERLKKVRNGPPSAEDMIKHASGTTFDDRRYSIWDRDDVATVQLRLGYIYVGLFVLFGALIIMAGQTLRSASA